MIRVITTKVNINIVTLFFRNLVLLLSSIHTLFFSSFRLSLYKLHSYYSVVKVPTYKHDCTLVLDNFIPNSESEFP
jgi:hypothetical protein